MARHKGLQNPVPFDGYVTSVSHYSNCSHAISELFKCYDYFIDLAFKTFLCAQLILLCNRYYLTFWVAFIFEKKVILLRTHYFIYLYSL